MDTSLFFASILLPDDLANTVTGIKNEIAVNYNSKSALRVMPHITLKAPFRVDRLTHASVLDWFNQTETGVQPFDVSLNGFGAFDNAEHPVLFIKPAENIAMQQLQSRLLQSFDNKFPADKVSPYEYKFHPHVTIGYRDLAREEFERAWPIYKDKEFNAQFKVNSYWLLQHNGRQWEPVIEKIL